ncbi:disease resistance protein RPM1-like [Rosa rugosa]|uniref:disease resistance protein RPM1-like n=1 Tax=Rosa rugosa TaxID=74645 RepID=UPI002B413789|nr:disease resistance protein RPM1-like [Rosa rugosa]
MHKLVSHDHGVDKLMHKQVLKLVKQVAFWVSSLNLSARIDRIDVKNTDVVRKLASQPYDSRRVSKSRLGCCSPQDSELANYNEVQGFEALAQKLFENLIDEEPQLSTICVVGPGGSGKSTLVNFVFKWKVVELFECKTWVRVTRRPLPPKELLQHMLTDFGYKNLEEINDPGAKLRLFLQQRRYLVVLDDVWSKQDFDCIVKALPNGAPGSKMILTSRNSSVVSFLSPKYIHDLSSGLSPEAAKNLITRKVLHNHLGNLQPEVEECTDKILRWCGNQPFAISAVGSLLAEKPQTRAEWEDIYNNLGSKTGPGSILEIVSNILQPSFMDLPNHLKSSFLYLSIFPPNYAIQHERLIHLWVAEGLAEHYAPSWTRDNVLKR